MSVKQIIVMRTDLNMRKGKMVAQGAHASMAVLLEMIRGVPYQEYTPHLLPGNQYEMKCTIQRGSVWDEWMRGSFTKICVKANSEEELVSLYKKAKHAGLPAALITDNGYTEFGGKPTITCCAIGPANDKDLIGLTDHLSLL